MMYVGAFLEYGYNAWLVGYALFAFYMAWGLHESFTNPHVYDRI